MPHPQHQIVWAEIPVSDIEAARAFYSAVMKTDLSVDTSGPNPMVLFPTSDPDGVAGHLYPGKPSQDGVGPTVHLVSPDDLEATADRVVEAGGKVLSPAIDIPAGSFIYTLDPDGNSVGWFQPKAA